MKKGHVPEIRVELSGGLGNQIFGYTAGLLAQAISGGSLKFDFRDVSYVHNFKKYDLRSFALDQRIIDSKFFSMESHIRVKRIKDILNYRSRTYRAFRKFTQDSFIDLSEPWGNQINPYFMELSRNTTLSGPYASFAYVDELEKILGNPLRLVLLNESQWLQEKTIEMQEKSPMCLHIRRGDYVSLEKTESKIGLLSSKYYENAISTIIKKEDNIQKVWVFSDSPEIVHKTIKKFELFPEIDFEMISTPNDHDPAESLILQSRAKYNVIANSSFSHWAAKLNLNSVITVYPSNYYSNSNKRLVHDYSDWVPVESSWETDEIG